MTLCTFHSLCMLTEAVHSVWWEGLESPSDPEWSEVCSNLVHMLMKSEGGTYTGTQNSDRALPQGQVK